ncbi:helix-turn-helix transcriptional regulator [Paenibacillus sp. SC116]|uniref:Helix-turn-helix transcriptional regulator n=1 Tax=Paenibacillus agilis TaxID=3020863 RepID=A0A559IBZ5_9BACL|nr:helix-turn-helix transcriptional regulator [Paenibacillus agilis]MCR8846612.1 helix-turn-helix transcriptional regulator [Paenibacillus sp. SC116]TVX85177.1 helix-turn-helix transcriptional regulator [Paenibacillus agilis]
MEANRFSKRIRAFRKLRGMTQIELAEMTDVSITVIGEIERGNRSIDDRLLQRIAQALRVTVEELVGS